MPGLTIITGGCGELGRAVCQRLAREGHRIAVLDIVSDPATVALTRAAGAESVVPCDQVDREQVASRVKELVGATGRLEVAIANAAWSRRDPFLQVSTDTWRRHLDVNLTGYFNVAQVAAEMMLNQPRDAQGVRGRILMTSSWVGQRPLPGGLPYVVSKAGVDGMVRALAQELAPEGVHVNAVAPGLIDTGLTRAVCAKTPHLHHLLTDLIPVGQMATPEQVAGAYAFLCSADAAYVTGHVVVVDGGCSVGNPRLG